MPTKRILTNLILVLTVLGAIFGLVADTPDFVAFITMSTTWHAIVALCAASALVWVNRDWLRAKAPRVAGWLPASMAMSAGASAAPIDTETVANLRKELTSNNRRTAEFENDVTLLLLAVSGILMAQSAKRRRQFAKLEEMPGDRTIITDRWLKEQTELAAELTREMQRYFQATRLAYELRMAEEQGKSEADSYMNASGDEERPKQVNAYLWRNYYVERAKYHRVWERIEGFLDEFETVTSIEFIGRLQDRIASRRAPS